MDTIVKTSYRVLLGTMLIVTVLLQSMISIIAAPTPVDRNEIKISNLNIVDQSTPDTGLQYDDTFKLNLTWDSSAYGNSLQKGDFFNVKLPDMIKFPSTIDATEFNIFVPNTTQVLAHASVKPGNNGGGTAQVTFSDYVVNQFNANGTLSLTGSFIRNQVKWDEKNTFEASIIGSTVPATPLAVDIIGPYQPKNEVLAKWSDGNGINEAIWNLRINHSKQTLRNVSIKDQLTIADGNLETMSFIPSSFTLSEVSYDKYGNVTTTISSRDVSSSVILDPTKTSFIYDMGDIGNKQYLLSYKSSYISGKKLVNHAILDSGSISVKQENSYESFPKGAGQEKLGRLSVLNRDGISKLPLSGSEFALRNSNGVLLKNILIGQNGLAVVDNLPIGTYTITEIKASNGYQLISTPQSVTVDESNLSPYITIDSAVIPAPTVGSLSITAQNGITLEKLAKTKFELKDSGGGLVATLITDSNGIALANNLPLGNYTLVSTKVPFKYQQITTPLAITINDKNANISLPVNINKISAPIGNEGSLSIIKQDSTNSVRLFGTELELKDSLGVVVARLVTDSNGIASVSNIPAGKYTLAETKATKGYLLNATPVSLTINSGSAPTTLIIPSTKIAAPVNSADNSVDANKIIIIKQDQVTLQKLAGAEFDIKNSNGDIIDHVIINIDGIGSSKSLPIGDYITVETKAPVGYELNTTPVKVQIKTSGQNKKITVNNVRSAGPVAPITSVARVQVLKQDSATKEKLTGAEFDIKNSKGITVGHIVTNEKGIATSKDLPLGQYSLVETVAPMGYTIEQIPVSFSLTARNQVVSLTFDSKKTQISPTAKINNNRA